MQPSVLVLGAAGRFGMAASAAFAAAGWHVFGQVRPGRNPAVLPEVPGVEWLTADLADADALAARAAGARVVVHALNPRLYCNAGWRAHGPSLMARAITVSRRLGATLMFPGNVYNFGADMPDVLREDTPQQATDAKGRVRIAVESALQTAVAAGGMRAVVIRSGDFFGAGKGSWFDEVLAKDFWRGRVVVPGGLEIDHAWAYVPDLARAFVRVAERRDALDDFAVLHFGGHTVRNREWVAQFTRVARRLGWLEARKSLTVRTLPWWMLRLAGLFSPKLCAVADMRHLWQRPHRLDNARLVALIGEEPHTPLDTAADIAIAALYPHVLDQHDPLGPHVSAGTA